MRKGIVFSFSREKGYNQNVEYFFTSYFLKCVSYEGKLLNFVTRLLPIAAPIYRQSRLVMGMLLLLVCYFMKDLSIRFIAFSFILSIIFAYICVLFILLCPSNLDTV